MVACFVKLFVFLSVFLSVWQTEHGKLLQSTDETDRPAAVTVEVVPIHEAVIEVQVERVVRVARAGRRRPIAAVASNIVDSRAGAVARGGQKDRTGFL